MRYPWGLNPIEQAWPQLKTHLRAKAARSLEALEAEPGQRPLDTITVQDAQGSTPPRRLPGSQ